MPQEKEEISTNEFLCVSKFGRTSVFFVGPGVKINGQCYRNELLARMLPEMNNLSRSDYIFFQDGGKVSYCKNNTRIFE